MRKYFITLTVAAFGLALPAHAGSINLNAPDDTGLIFTPLPGNMVQVAGSVGGAVAGYQTPAECGSGFCLENASATFDANFTAQLTRQYNYSTSAGGSFNFSGNIYDPSGSGILIATDSLTAAITWNSLHFVDDGSYSSGPSISGTGIVTASSGDAAFEADFPLSGTFDIDAGFLGEPCGRFPPSCAPNQIISGALLGGALVPTPVPSPLIGKPGWLMLLCLAVLGLVRRYRTE